MEFVSRFTAPASVETIGSEVTVPTVYTVTVYAKKKGYLNSEPATEDIDIRGLKGDADGDGELTIADVTTIIGKLLGND